MAFNQYGVVIVDLEGRVKFANNFFCDLVGIDSDKVVDVPWSKFMFAEDSAKAKLLIERSKHPFAQPSRLRLRQGSDGSAVLVDIQGSPLALADGKVYGVTATITVVATSREPQVAMAARAGSPK